MDLLVIIGLSMVLVACVFCDVVSILSRKKLRELVYWCEEGYELGTSDEKREFIEYYNATEQGRYCPAYLENDEVFVKGRVGDHKITWLGNKIYNDRSYVDVLDADFFRFYHFWRLVNWLRCMKFHEHIEWLHDGICVMEVIAKAYDSNHPIPKLATRKTTTYKGLVPLGLVGFFIGVVVLLLGIFIVPQGGNAEIDNTMDQTVNTEIEELKRENEQLKKQVEDSEKDQETDSIESTDTADLSTLEPTATPKPTPILDDTYLLKNSDTKYLKEKNLRRLSKKELRLARNEIYARHGCIFSDKSLNKYFKKKAWYKPKIKVADFSESKLNKYEKANIQLILDIENGVTPESWIGEYLGVDFDAEFDVLAAYDNGIRIVSVNSEGSWEDDYFCEFTKGYSFAEYDDDGWTKVTAHKEGDYLYITIKSYYDGSSTSYTLRKI